MVKPSRTSRPLTHGQVWGALDRLAERAGMSASGLARRAGLDPTTFNKSKRITADGRERWPSTESVAKALDAAAAARPAQSVPLLGLAQAASSGHFDENGFPTGKGWDEMALPSPPEAHAYALEISGDSMRPVYRDGDIVVVSPGTAIRRGDRVVVKTTSGEVTVKELNRRTAKTLELQSLNASHPDRVLTAEDVAWIARIVWASQ